MLARLRCGQLPVVLAALLRCSCRAVSPNLNPSTASLGTRSTGGIATYPWPGAVVAASTDENSRRIVGTWQFGHGQFRQRQCDRFWSTLRATAASRAGISSV